MMGTTRHGHGQAWLAFETGPPAGPAREKGGSFRRDRHMRIEGRCPCQVMSEKTKVTKTKTALKQETYNLSDLKHDLHCGFVELGGSVSVSS